MLRETILESSDCTPNAGVWGMHIFCESQGPTQGAMKVWASASSHGRGKGFQNTVAECAAYQNSNFSDADFCINALAFQRRERAWEFAACGAIWFFAAKKIFLAARVSFFAAEILIFAAENRLFPTSLTSFFVGKKRKTTGEKRKSPARNGKTRQKRRVLRLRERRFYEQRCGSWVLRDSRSIRNC